MRSLRSSSRFGVRTARLCAALVPWLGVVGCTYPVRGVIDGNLVRAGAPTAPPTAPGAAPGAPPPQVEPVRFTWQSNDGGFSGEIQTALPGGEVFMGQYHEIVASTPVHTMGGFCGAWYGGPWVGPGWYGGPWVGGWYGGAWPYYRSCDGFLSYYTGQVVALLDGDRGARMRCYFRLDDPNAGMRSGGWGECQVSNGDRITAMFETDDVRRAR